MFRVLVLGGVALVAGACGGSTAATGNPAGDDGGSADSGQDGNFPHEGGGNPCTYDPQLCPDAFPSETASEAGMMFDAGLDADADANADAPCFPQETALPPDAACGPGDAGASE